MNPVETERVIVATLSAFATQPLSPQQFIAQFLTGGRATTA